MLANAVKHAQAERVEVRLSERRTAIAVSVSDAGSGFDPEDTGGGFGLIGALRDVCGKRRLGSPPS